MVTCLLFSKIIFHFKIKIHCFKFLIKVYLKNIKYELCFFFFFLFLALMNSNRHYSCTWLHCAGDKVTVHALFIGPTTTLFRKKIKNGSHGTIHIFKIYFTTVLSIFSKISCIQMNPEFAFIMPNQMPCRLKIKR